MLVLIMIIIKALFVFQILTVFELVAVSDPVVWSPEPICTSSSNSFARLLSSSPVEPSAELPSAPLNIDDCLALGAC